MTTDTEWLYHWPSIDSLDKVLFYEQTDGWTENSGDSRVSPVL